MEPPNGEPRPERGHTDESLRAERQKTDEEIAKAQKKKEEQEYAHESFLSISRDPAGNAPEPT